MLQQLNKLSNPIARIMLYAVAAILLVTIINWIVIKLCLLSGIPWPWSFLQSIHQVGWWPLIIATILVSALTLSGHFYVKGGVHRISGIYVAIAVIAFVSANWIAVAFFISYAHLHLTPTPWLAYTLIHDMQPQSSAYRVFVAIDIACLFVLGLLVSMKLFMGQGKASKIHGQAHFASAWNIQKAGLYANSGVVLGKAYGKFIRSNQNEGILVNAPTGAGKTTAIAIPNLIEWTGSGIFNDIKGELYQLTSDYRRRVLKNKVYQFAPANHDKNTDRYNPFAYVSQNPDLRIRDIQLIAEILIPSERIDGGFWYTSSREVFLLLSLYLFETEGMATLGGVHDLSKQEDFFTWLDFTVSEKEVTDMVFYQNAHSLLDADDKTRQNILKDFHSRLSLFSDPMVRHATSDNDFDLAMLRQKKMSVYIHIPDADKERLRPLLTLFWAQTINLLTQILPNTNEEPYKVLALLDEFGNMAKISKLREGMSFLRAYHVIPIVIVQYLSQITAIYGQHEAKGFMNAKIRVVFALNDMDDAKFVSSALGKKTVKVSSNSVNVGDRDSRSHNVSYQGSALLSPDEIMQLPKNKEIILLESQSPIKANKCYWFKEPLYKDVFTINS